MYNQYESAIVAVYTYGTVFRVVVNDAVVGVYATRDEALFAAEAAIDALRTV